MVQLHVIYHAWGLYEGNTGPWLEDGVDDTQERNFFSWYGLEQVNDWMVEKRFVETIPCPILRKYWTDWKTFLLAELSYWPSHLSQWRNNYTHRWHIRVLEVSKCEKELCFLRLLADARFLDSLYSRCRSRFFFLTEPGITHTEQISPFNLSI